MICKHPFLEGTARELCVHIMRRDLKLIIEASDIC